MKFSHNCIFLDLICSKIFIILIYYYKTDYQMGGCNPCAAQYSHEKKGEDKGYLFNQYYGTRPLEIYKKEDDLQEIGIVEWRESNLKEDKLLLERKAKFKAEIRNEIEKRYFRNSEKYQMLDMTPIILELIDLLCEAVYQNIKKSAPQDLEHISLSKMLQNVTPLLQRSYLQVAMAFDKEKFPDKDTKPWEKIQWYCNAIRPGFTFDESEDADKWGYDSIENQILAYILKGAIVCPQLTRNEEIRLKIFHDNYMTDIAKQLYRFGHEKWHYLDFKQLVRQAELCVLRSVSYEDYNALQLVKYFNQITRLKAHREKIGEVEDEEELEFYYRSDYYMRDLEDLPVLRRFISKAIEEYEHVNEHKDLKITEVEENEIVALSRVQDKDLFRQLLQAIYTDVEDSKFKPDKDFSHKLRCMTQILINGSMNMRKDQNEEVTFIIPEDINMCCNLVRMRLDKLNATILDQQWGANQVHKTLDALNQILMVMQKFMLKGFSIQAYKALKESLTEFLSTLEGRFMADIKRKLKAQSEAFRAIIVTMGEATSFDEQEESTHKLGFKLQAMMAMQALNRIHHKFSSDFTLATEFASEAFGGTMALAKGLASFDMDQLEEASGELSKFALKQYDKSPKDWYDDIYLMFELANTDFEQFEKIFFSGEDHEIVKRMKLSDVEAKSVVTYYTIKCLDQVIRKRTNSFDTRMRAITLMRYVHDGKNYENKKGLHFSTYPTMAFFVKVTLAALLKMRLDKENFMDADKVKELTGYAEKVLYSIHIESPKGNRYVRKLIQELAADELGTKQEFDFYDFSLMQGNNIISTTLRVRMPLENLLSRLQKQAMEDYHKTFGSINSIHLMGVRYLDGFEDFCINCDETQAQMQHVGKTFKSKDSRVFRLDTEAQFNFMKSDRRSMLISGNSGSGKSMYLSNLLKWQWDRYNSGNCMYIPILIKLNEIEKYSNCLEETLEKFGDQKFTKEMLRDSTLDSDCPLKFVFLIDDFDQIASARNLLEINKFNEWGRETKFIFTSPTDSGSFEDDKDYVNLFQFKDDEDQLLEYRIQEISNQQIREYVKLMVTKNKIDIATKEEETNNLDSNIDLIIQKSKFGCERKYMEMISNLKLLDIIDTAFMMDKVISSLPSIQTKFSKFHHGSDISRQIEFNIASIYEIVVEKQFEEQRRRIIKQYKRDIPKGYNLIKSFWNFSSSFAIELWLQDKKSIKTFIPNYPFPQYKLDAISGENEFQAIQKNGDQGQELVKKYRQFSKFFENNNISTKLAREGCCQIADEGGRARFIHYSFHLFFVAQVLFKYLNEFDPESKKSVQLEDSYLNKKLLTGKCDDNKGVLAHIRGKIYQARIAQSSADDVSKAEKNILWAIRKLTLDNCNEIYMQNILTIACHFPQLIQEIPQDVQQYILKSSLPKGSILGNKHLQVKLLMSIATHAKNEGDQSKADRQHLQAINKILEGKYKGKYTYDEIQNRVFAQGKGQIKYDNGSHYVGTFENNCMSGKGFLVFSEESQDLYEGNKRAKAHNQHKALLQKKQYSGNFKNHKMHGQGSLEYEFGSQYIGMFSENQRHGPGSMFFQSVNCEYHGNWKNDRRQGKGDFICKQEDNQYHYQGGFENHQLHGKGEIIFGQHSDFKNLIFKGIFADGICQSGAMWISKTECFQGVISLKKDLKYKFYFDWQTLSDFSKTVIYYETSDDKIKCSKFDSEKEGKTFFSQVEKLMYQDVFVKGKILIRRGQIQHEMGLDTSIENCIKQARKDKLLHKEGKGQVELLEEEKQIEISTKNLVSKFKEDNWSKAIAQVQDFHLA